MTIIKAAAEASQFIDPLFPTLSLIIPAQVDRGWCYSDPFLVLFYWLVGDEGKRKRAALKENVNSHYRIILQYRNWVIKKCSTAATHARASEMLSGASSSVVTSCCWCTRNKTVLQLFRFSTPFFLAAQREYHPSFVTMLVLLGFFFRSRVCTWCLLAPECWSFGGARIWVLFIFFCLVDTKDGIIMKPWQATQGH